MIIPYIVMILPYIVMILPYLIVGSGLPPSETIGLLSQAGLFDTAFSIAQKFSLPLKNIFEALATK